MVADSLTSFVDCLRRASLLKAEQLAELPQLQRRFTDPRALAGELVRRGWLTTYQAKQVLAGKIGDLALGSYVVLDLLGEGGMGQVFKARHAKLGKTVALKVIRRDHTTHPDAVRRFQREIQAASRVSHPHIVHSLDAESSGDSHFLVMEYIEGTDLARLVRDKGPLPVAQACDYIRQAALGLQHAHERGMVHRDIKPANLLLSTKDKVRSTKEEQDFVLRTSYFGLVKIADMGLARWRSTDESSSKGLTREGSVLGTVDYVAPEQAMDSHAVDIRADLYSLGCAFYFLLTGRVPFPGGEALEKLYRHRYEQPTAIETLRSEVPASVLAVVRKLMAKQPDDRYQTPGELATALAALERGLPAPGIAGASVKAVRKPSRRRPWRRIVLAGTVLLVVGAGLVIFQMRDPDHPSVPMALQRASAAGSPIRPAPTGTPAPPQTSRPETRPSPTKQVDPPVVPPTSTAADLQTPQQIRRFTGHTGGVNWVALSPDGKFILSASDDQTVRLWEFDTGKEVRQFKGHTDRVHSVVFSDDGQRALSTSGRYDGSDKSMRLWNIADGKEIRRFDGHDQAPTRAVFLSDGRALSAGWDSTIRLWNVETGQLRNTIAIKPKTMLAGLVPLADGTQALVGGRDRVIRLVDLQNGRELRQFAGHTDSILDMAISPDGRQMASTGLDRTVRIWDFNTGELIRTITGHTGTVTHVVYLHDGKRIASSSSDNTVRIWEVATGKELLRCNGHNTAVQCVITTPDDRHLISASYDFTIRLWAIAR